MMFSRKANGLIYQGMAVLILFFAMVSHGSADTNVSGPLPCETRWMLPEGPYIVTGNILVEEDCTLTIDPGVIVKFASDKSLQIDGELIAQGTAVDKIFFTSNSSSPAPGDWGYILFNDSSTDATYDIAGSYVTGSILEHVVVEYAGGVSVTNNGSLRLDNAHPFINYTTIRNNAAPGIYAWNISRVINVANCSINNNITGDGINVTGSGGTIAVNNSGISQNAGRGIHIGAVTGEILNNIISDNLGGGIYINNFMPGALTGTIANNIIVNNSGSDGAGIWVICGNVNISSNKIANNSARNNGGGVVIDTYPAGWSSGPVGIRNNEITGNHSVSGGGIYIFDSYTYIPPVPVTIQNNIISFNSASDLGGGIFVNSHTATILNNSLLGNISRNASGLSYGTGDNKDIKYNTFSTNIATGPMPTHTVYFGSHPFFNYNNLFNNDSMHEFSNDNVHGSASINAENNWWGTSAPSAISDKIYDWFDDSTKGIVDYSPYSTAILTDPPISPPKDLTATAGTNSIILTWSPNPETDLAGYIVYWGTTSGHPYANMWNVVGTATNYTIPALAPGQYYVTVTAYDTTAAAVIDDPDTIVNEKQTDGNESWYAEEMAVELVVIGFSTAGSSASEATTPASITVTLSAASGQTVTVNYATANGTAMAGSDYTAKLGTLTFDPGVTSRTIDVSIINDTAVEGNETFTVTLSGPVNATLGAITTHTYTINNDDNPGTIQLSSATYGVNENGGSVLIPVTRTGGSSGSVGVSYSTSNGTATAGADYTATSGPLTWADGDSSNKTISVLITNDVLDEVNETFTVTLSNPTGGATLGSPSSATATITDDDPTPTVQFSTASSSGSEATTPASITVTLSAASGQTVTVNYETANGTATGGSDYTGTNGMLTFNPGVTSQTINVSIINDTAVEGNETFTVTLSGPVNATLGAITTHTYTINNDDYAGTIQFRSATYSVSESGGSVLITVTRTGGSSGAVGVSYATSNGTATAGADYTATSGPLTWGDGDSSNKTFTVPIIDDALDEVNETFTVTLLDPAGGATLGSPSSATVTITDDDPGPNISALPGSYDFGLINVGSDSASQIFEISNTGDANLVIGTVTLSGGDVSEFEKQTDTCSGATILPLGQCTVRVRFNPASEGLNKSANLSIPSNDPVTPSLAILLTGGGTLIVIEDVPPEHWAYGFIMKLYESGITGGCATNPLRFCPDQPITRGQMAVFIETALGHPPNACDGRFADVPTTHTFCGFIERMADDGITTGCGSDNFCPNDPVTRGQMAVFIETALGVGTPPSCSEIVFDDVNAETVGAAFCGFIEDFATRGITGGCSLNPPLFCPNDPVTRAQMAVFLSTASLGM